MGWVSSLQVDSALENVAEHKILWTTEDVFNRLIEAAETERCVPERGKPSKSRGGMWPQMAVEAIEALEDYDDSRDQIERRVPSAGAISRWEEVVEWYGLYVTPKQLNKKSPSIPEAIFSYMTCVVRPHLSLVRLCRKRAWSKMTTYRRINEAIELIVEGLNAGYAPVVLADPDIIAPYVQKKR